MAKATPFIIGLPRACPLNASEYWTTPQSLRSLNLQLRKGREKVNAAHGRSWRNCRRGFEHTQVAAWCTLFGFIALIPWTARELWDIPSFHVTGQGFFAAVYLGMVVTVAGLFIWLSQLRVVPARVAASVQYLQPVVGVVAASAMFGDRVWATFVLGVALVLAGLALSMTSHRPAGKYIRSASRPDSLVYKFAAACVLRGRYES